MRIPSTTHCLLALLLSSVCSPAQNAAPQTTIPDGSHFQSQQNYQTMWEDYYAIQKGKQLDLIFIGDSITQRFRWGHGRPVWQKYFANRALDFGEDGDTTQNVLWRLKNIDVREFKPKVAVILIGTNNTKNTPQEIAAGVKAVVTTTQETFGEIKIILVSILPNARATATMAAVNELIKNFADNQSVFYLDLASKFTPQGDNWKGLDGDRLHPTTLGYELWQAELQPLLDKLLPAHESVTKQ